MENLGIFNNWKHNLEDIEIKTQLDCLRIIELNICSICNLKCGFCPQSKKINIPKNPFISLDIINELTKQLSNIQYKGYICIAGHGEPTLHPNFIEIINKLKNFKTILITNGTIITENQISQIKDKCQMKVSVHDWSKIEFFKEKFKNTNAVLRNHDIKTPEMNLYNRGGYLSKPVEKIEKICNYLFYKIMVDIDGHYMQCEADWEKKSKTDYSLFDMPIDKYFLSLDRERDKMLKIGHRQNCEACVFCDINGTMAGDKFVEFYINGKRPTI